MNEYEQILFEEKQRLPKWLFWVTAAASVITAMVVCFVFKIQENTPVAAVIAVMFVLLSTPVFLWIFTLDTQVRQDGLYFKIYLMMPRYKKIGFDEIQECCAREYKPISEYGGWGIKWGKSGKAYNMSGKEGVQLVLQDGKRILIGSQKADELAEAIESAKQNLK